MSLVFYLILICLLFKTKIIIIINSEMTFKEVLLVRNKIHEKTKICQN